MSVLEAVISCLSSPILQSTRFGFLLYQFT